jgi:hypothetical protein
MSDEIFSLNKKHLIDARSDKAEQVIYHYAHPFDACSA